MNTFLKTLIAVAAFTAAQLPASAQLVAHLDGIELQANQVGQVFDFLVENTGDVAVTGIDGFTFVLKVGDGTAGPRIQGVDLKYGSSVFGPSAYVQSGPLDPDPGTSEPLDLYAFYIIDSDGVHPATLAAHTTTVLARLTFNTTGLTVADGPWPVSIEGSEYTLNVLSGNPQYLGFDSGTTGTLTIVPEPSAYAAVMGVLMVGFAGWRRMKRAK